MANKVQKFEKRRLRSSYVSTVVSISLVLFMLGALGFVALNAKKIADYAKERILLSIVLKDNLKDVDVEQFKKSLDISPYVKAAEYVPKKQAADRLQKELEGEDFIGVLDYNPLPNAIELNLHADYANPDGIAKIKKELLKNDMVKEVFYQKSLVASMNENLETISIVLAVFCALLFIISIALINNTIRLALHSKRFLIKTMQLVGATGKFIRKPFVQMGILNGLYAAMIASGLLTGVVYLTQKEIPELIEIEVQNALLFGSLFVLIFIMGIIISWVSTYLAIEKYLKLHSDELY